VRFDPSFVSQMSDGLLLVKLVGLSVCPVCLVVVVSKSFVGQTTASTGPLLNASTTISESLWKAGLPT